MLKKLKNQSGFTIVELLIVIVVIGILAALVLNTFQGVQARARDTERKTDLVAISTQLEAYYTDFGHYPSGSATVDTCGANNGGTYTGDCDLVVLTTRGLDPEALNDPNNNQIIVNANPGNANDNQYYYDVTGANCTGERCDAFTLSAVLESDGTTFTKNSIN